MICLSAPEASFFYFLQKLGGD